MSLIITDYDTIWGPVIKDDLILYVVITQSQTDNTSFTKIMFSIRFFFAPGTVFIQKRMCVHANNSRWGFSNFVEKIGPFPEVR